MVHQPWYWKTLGILTLLAIPILIVFGIDGLGSAQNASKVADMLGVWYFSWGMVFIGCLAAIVVSWQCFTNASEVERS
jgi:hypothetical protein